jgi:hypothetical protein
MNNSIFKKNKTSNEGSYSKNGINLNDLSATSSNFMSMINPNMRGGGAFMDDINRVNRNSCVCEDVFGDFNSKHIKNALDLINTSNVCLRCKDKEGNTILHYIVHCSKSNNDCKNTLFKLIDNNKVNKSNINIQNNRGETPILIAAFDKNDEAVDKLYNAGADLSIRDNEGNNIGVDDNKSSQSSDIVSSLDLGTETIGRPTGKKISSNQDFDISSYIPGFILEMVNSTGNTFTPDKTPAQTIWLKPRGTFHRDGSEIEEVSTPEQVKTNNGTRSKQGISDTDFKFESDSIQPTKNSKGNEDLSISVDVGETSTEDAFQGILDKYAGKEQGKKQDNTVVKEIFLEKEVPQQEKVETISDQNTDNLLEAINAINTMGDKQTMEPKQRGGKNKISGYRNMNMSDSSAISESFNINTSSNESGFSDGISDNGYAAFYNEEEFGAVKNELSRMMQRQRDNLHQQVLDMIMGMLNKGELTHDSVVIKASEKNAKLIKAYIYRKVSEKNPQMGGLDKILSISKMSEQQISDKIKDMPDLDEIEKNIQKHIEQRKSERDSEPKKSKKSKNTETSDSIDIDIDLSETVESEKPKKKSSSKSKSAKKPSKKSKK